MKGIKFLSASLHHIKDCLKVWSLTMKYWRNKIVFNYFSIKSPMTSILLIHLWSIYPTPPLGQDMIHLWLNIGIPSLKKVKSWTPRNSSTLHITSSLNSKAIQSYNLLLHYLQTKPCEWARYPWARAYLSKNFHLLFDLIISFIFLNSAVH